MIRLDEQQPTEVYGKVITAVVLEDNVLKLWFEDGRCLSLEDDLSLCCERRYMTNEEDDIEVLEGRRLMGIEVKPGDGYDADEYGDYTDVQFLEITTDYGSATVANHNEHNGYYGGFDIAWKLE